MVPFVLRFILLCILVELQASQSLYIYNFMVFGLVWPGFDFIIYFPASIMIIVTLLLTSLSLTVSPVLLNFF